MPPPTPKSLQNAPPHPEIISYFPPRFLKNTHFSNRHLFYVHIDIAGYFQTQNSFFQDFVGLGGEVWVGLGVRVSAKSRFATKTLTFRSLSLGLGVPPKFSQPRGWISRWRPVDRREYPYSLTQCPEM